MSFITNKTKAPVVISTLGLTLKPGASRYVSAARAGSAHLQQLKSAGIISISADAPTAPSELIDARVPEYSVAALAPPSSDPIVKPPVEEKAKAAEVVAPPAVPPVDPPAPAANPVVELPARDVFLSMSREDREKALLAAGVLDQALADKDPSKSDLLKLYDAAAK